MSFYKNINADPYERFKDITESMSQNWILEKSDKSIWWTLSHVIGVIRLPFDARLVYEWILDHKYDIFDISKIQLTGQRNRQMSSDRYLNWEVRIYIYLDNHVHSEITYPQIKEWSEYQTSMFFV